LLSSFFLSLVIAIVSAATKVVNATINRSGAGGDVSPVVTTTTGLLHLLVLSCCVRPVVVVAATRNAGTGLLLPLVQLSPLARLAMPWLW